MKELLTILVVVPIAILVIRGLWRATGVQGGTGCPVCDALHGKGDHAHGEGDHDQQHAKDSPPKAS